MRIGNKNYSDVNIEKLNITVGLINNYISMKPSSHVVYIPFTDFPKEISGIDRHVLFSFLKENRKIRKFNFMNTAKWVEVFLKDGIGGQRIKLERNLIRENTNKKSGNEFKLKLDYNSVTREIKINNKLISRPNFDSTNHSIFEFLYENNDKEFTKESLRDKLKINKIKNFGILLNDLNIKGTIRKYLFSLSKNKIKLRKEIFIDDKDDIKKIAQELKELPKTKPKK